MDSRKLVDFRKWLQIGNLESSAICTLQAVASQIEHLLQRFVQRQGRACADPQRQAVNVPEPSSIFLIFAGLLPVSRRRKLATIR